MLSKIENFIKIIYGKWKADSLKHSDSGTTHPDEETLASFMEGRLPERGAKKIIEHVLSCHKCSEAIVLQAKIEKMPEQEVPPDLILRAKDLVEPQIETPLLEVAIKIKENILELLNTSGDILVGHEFMPAPVLRSRKIKEFKDEITVLKDFTDIRVELKIENKPGKIFDVNVCVKEKATQKMIKDLRVTLMRDGLELESYVNDAGVVTFEHVLAGSYTVKISSLQKTIARVILEVKA
ncbi:MAG: hypothetical protein DRP74_06395 [Candidatus Omnitrophota bacterium]|nr:MAG: hypothetical protein DRP74_06395 [Candidatus Omnitrophota bacterium]